MLVLEIALVLVIEIAPMPVYGYEPLKLDRFGGLNSLLDPTNLPPFMSPDCADVEFAPGLVRTRPGLTSQFATLAGNPTVNYLKTYITPAQALRMLALDSFGKFYKENPQGTLALVSTEIIAPYANSTSLFSREYIAFGDGKFGVDIPRQFDDTNLDRVSQGRPGLAPVAIDEIISVALLASPNGIGIPATQAVTAASQVGNIVTLTNAGGAAVEGDNINVAGVGAGYNGQWIVISTPAGALTYAANQTGLAPLGAGGTIQVMRATVSTVAAFPAAPGMLVTFAGVGVAAWNTTFTVFKAPNPTTFTVTVPLALMGTAASGGGTVTTSGNISAGIHKISVVFVTRQGYITAPAPPAQWTATGSKRVIVSNIPTGPPNVTARILLFTATAGTSFFYLADGVPQIFSSAMRINDNTTTSVTVDFSDAILLTGTNADDLFRLLELGECSGVLEYSSRLFWWGEKTKVENFLNLSFDGGFGVASPSGAPYPLGWDPDPTLYPGGNQGGPFVWGGSYGITGDGATAVRGLITQSAFQDFSNVPILLSNVGYSVSFRCRRAGAAPFTQGVAHIEVFSTSAAIQNGFTLACNTLTQTFQVFTGVMTTALATIPSDLQLRIYLDGTPTNVAIAVFDEVEVYPTNQPFNVTTVRSSKIEDPESYDGVDGFLNIAPENGQAVRSCFVIRDLLYIVKERSLYVTADDGINEPANWTIREVSNRVGTLSVRGIGVGEEWVLIAGRDGVYIFDGGTPQKVSQEIQPTWDAINWQFGHLIDVKVDIKRKRAYIAIPFGAATSPDRMLTLDFTEGFGDPTQDGTGRKWVPWIIPSKSMNLIQRDDGTQQFFIGNNTATGKIYKLDSAATIDDGTAINSYWQSGYFQDGIRLDYGYLIANVAGSGICNLSLFKGDQSWLRNLRGWTLNSLAFRNLERQIQMNASRMSVKFGTNTVGHNFSLQGTSMWVKESTWAPLRGINA